MMRCDGTTVRKYLERANLTPNRSIAPPGKIPPDIAEQVRKLYAEGAPSFNAVARKLGLQRQQLWRYVPPSLRCNPKTVRSRAAAKSGAADDHRNGMSVTAIAEKYGVGEDMVRRVLKRENIQITPKNTKPKIYDARILQLHAQGLDNPTIAEKVGCALTTVHRALRRNS
jgi:DNA invertase Pin-like site-specific DNA recombinase